MAPMDLKSGRRGVGPCERVVMEAFIADHPELWNEDIGK